VASPYQVSVRMRGPPKHTASCRPVCNDSISRRHDLGTVSYLGYEQPQNECYRKCD